VLVAVPGGSIVEVFDTVGGWDGKTVIDATNLVGAQPPDGFSSNAEFVKSKTNGPTAKSFNLNFARLYDQIDSAPSRPSNIWSGDEEARDVVEQLNRDAGYDPVYAGGMDKTAVQEQGIALIFAVSQASGPYLYRIASPDEL
jgi:8-hydroxy-5-deazaflavin:NADPH oxidoreductase